MTDWADETAGWFPWDKATPATLAAALREAREPLEKEIAALHDMIGQAWAMLDPEEHPELCELLASTLACGTDGKLTPCTHYQQALDRAYEEGNEQAYEAGREQGAREERWAVWQACMDRATHKPSGSQTEFIEYEVARDIAIAIAARGPMSEPKEPQVWKCEACGEEFDCETWSHGRADHSPSCDGTCRNCPVEVECGPVSMSEGGGE